MMLQQVYFQNTLMDWLIAFAIILATFLVGSFIGPMIIRKLENIASRTSTVYDDVIVIAVGKFLFPFLYIGGIYLGLSYLVLPARADKIIHLCLLVVYTYFILRIIVSVLQYLLFSFLGRQEGGENKKKQANGLVIVIKCVVWIIGFVFLLDNLGYNVSAIIAGLGVGGIAIALAAQTVLSDLFSYFIILFDRPFEVGDFIIFENDMGTVEYLGVKSTRIRTLNGQLLICSNKDLTNARVNNYKSMEKRRVVFKLGVVYNTPAYKLEMIASMIKGIISANKDTEYDRGHFSGFGDSSLNFEFVYYVRSPEYNNYMDIQQRIYFAIFRTFEEEGIEFAFPTQTIYMNQVSAIEP